MNDSEMIVLY